MRLYLDDDIGAALLAQLLRKDGHDVQVPADAALAGSPDPKHLHYAIGQGRVFLTRNYGDFELLHELILQAKGHHPGILVVRLDNDPRRDLTPRGVVRAIRNLLAAGVPTADQYHILNHWR